MAATAQDVRRLDWTNMFGLLDDAQITCVLSEDVPCFVNESQWGSCATQAQALVAAHLIAMGLKGGSSPSGSVTAESAGGISRSYASSSMSGTGGFWQSTTFGMRYWALLSTRAFSPMVLHTTGVTDGVPAA